MCSGPVSPPTNSRLRSTSARSSGEIELAEIHDAIGAPARTSFAAAAIRPAASRSDGPELSTIRRSGEAAASPATRAVNAGSGHRRNGLPALTCATISSCSGAMPAACSRAAMRASAASSRAISTASRPGLRSAAGPPLDRLQQVPLIDDRMPLAERTRPRHRVRVHPASSLDFVPDPLRRPGRQRQPRASRSAVQVDHDIVPRAAQPARQADDPPQSAPSPAAWARRSPRRGADCRPRPARPPARRDTRRARPETRASTPAESAS